MTNPNINFIGKNDTVIKNCFLKMMNTSCDPLYKYNLSLEAVLKVNRKLLATFS